MRKAGKAKRLDCATDHLPPPHDNIIIEGTAPEATDAAEERILDYHSMRDENNCIGYMLYFCTVVKTT
jgi:hypothetical protein